MECDVAVLGGGPGGYTAAIRAAQLGAKTVCIEKEAALGGTCLRVGCIPTKAWVQTAFAIKEAEETFAKLGVNVGAPELDFAKSNEWKAAVVNKLTGGVAQLFKANGVEWVKGTGRFKDANTISVEGGEDVSFKSAIVATGSFPLRPPIDGIDSARCVDSTGLLAQTEVPKRLVILGGGIIGCEFASIFQRFGSEVTIVEMLPTLIPAEDADAPEGAAEAVQEARHRRPPRVAVQEGRGAGRRPGGALRRRPDRGLRPDAGRHRARPARGRPRPRGRRRSSSTPSRASPPTSTAGRRSRTSMRSATAPATGSSRIRRSARARSLRRTRWAMTRSSTTAAFRDRSTRIPRSRPSGSPSRRRASSTATTVAVGKFPWSANGRAMMQNETVGWVKSIHETRYGELLGLVMVGPHVTDLVEAGVVALDAEATVETIADGMTAHPTLSEAIKEAGLVALGRAIHLPNKKRAKASA